MAETSTIEIDLGDAVYSEDGEKIGNVRGADDSGFYVSTDEHVRAPTPSRYSTTAGEFDLMWRCWQCGETGRIEEFPDSCPNCGTGAEDLYYWTED